MIDALNSIFVSLMYRGIVCVTILWPSVLHSHSVPLPDLVRRPAQAEPSQPRLIPPWTPESGPAQPSPAKHRPAPLSSSEQHSAAPFNWDRPL